MNRAYPALVALSLCLLASSVDARLRTEELTVAGTDVSLAGRLFLPEGDGPFPAVVLVHGSGQGRRDGAWYAEIAGRLAERGIATLAHDKRGVGDSTGEYVEAPDLTVHAGDLVSWVDALHARDDIEGDAIGLMGWSQGGWTAPLAASMTDHVAFVVTVVGPGVSPFEQNVHDKTNQFRATGATEEQVATFEHTIRLVWSYIAYGTGREDAQAAWDAVHEEPWFVAGYNGPPMMDRDHLLAHPRMTSFAEHFGHEPVPVLRQLRVPMLAVFGGADPVVPLDESIAAMKAAFEENGQTLTVKVYPGANHGMQVVSSDGSHLAEGYPDEVIDWIEAQVRG